MHDAKAKKAQPAESASDAAAEKFYDAERAYDPFYDYTY